MVTSAHIGLRLARARLIGLCALLLFAGAAFEKVAGPPRFPDGLPPLDDVLPMLAGASLPFAPFVALIVDVVWLFWIWLFGSLCIELILSTADVLANGAAWVRSLHRVADRFSAPLARKMVTAAFAVQLVSRGVSVASAQSLDLETALIASASSSTDAGAEADAPGVPTYQVRDGDTLWSIAEAAYGSGDAYRRIIDANVGRQMPDGQVFSARGVIQPGWDLLLPGADFGLYIVQSGDTLSSIAAEQLGDMSRWTDLFDANRGAETPDRLHSLHDPDVIWPGLRLHIPSAAMAPRSDAAEPGATDMVVAVAPPPVVLDSPVAAAPAVISDSTAVPLADAPATTESDPPPLLRTPHAFDPVEREPVDAAPPELEADTTALPQDAPSADNDTSVPPPPWHTQVPTVPLAAGGIGLAAIAGLGFGAHRMRRRLRPLPQEPETEVVVEGGFAEAQPAHDLTRGLHGAGFDPLAALTGQLQQFLAEYNLASVGVLAVRHGRSSTTLTLRCALAEQALLLDAAPVFAERLGAEVEGWVTSDQDVSLRLTRLRRTRLLPVADQTGNRPGLVPLGVLYDRQIFSAAADALGHVLIASLPGHGSDTILTSLVATLTARRSPEKLRMWLLAKPRALPAAVYELPHLERVVDVTDSARVEGLMQELRSELDRRAAEPAAADLAIVIPELSSLNDRAESLALLATSAAQLGVHFLCASTDLDETLSNSLTSHLVTRMVLRMQNEETSVALLGIADAAFLSGGGRLLVRLDGREPVELYGYQVSAEHLERLVKLMRSAYKPTTAEIPAVIPPAPPPVPPVAPESIAQIQESEPADEAASSVPPLEAAQQTESPRAPIEVNCLGGPRVMCAGEQIWPNPSSGDAKPWELLLYLACQPEEGVAKDEAVEALWPELDAAEDAPHRFRQLRYRLRRLLLASPGAPESEGICLDRGRLRLDPGTVYSDAHEFLALVRNARVAHGGDAIDFLERARNLYMGDLLEGPDARRYAWATDRDSSGVTLREHFRRLFQQATQRLAELYQAGGTLDLALELYRELSEMDPADEQLWLALFRLHAERGDRLGLLREERRMRDALRELVEDLGPGEGDHIAELGRETMEEYRKLLASLREKEPATA